MDNETITLPTETRITTRLQCDDFMVDIRARLAANMAEDNFIDNPDDLNFIRICASLVNKE